METIAFSETSMCRRKYLLHYFGEDFDSSKCNRMCDNCTNPKSKIEGKDFITKLLNAVNDSRERFKPKEMAKILVGQTDSIIKQNMSQLQNIFGIGKEKNLLHFGIQLLDKLM